jgi:hypothetical protein
MGYDVRCGRRMWDLLIAHCSLSIVNLDFMRKRMNVRLVVFPPNFGAQ